ncbi:MAG: hypothetical protein SNJ67_03650 [Chloracidobacterium sp.]|uniref:Uncharacterized protein n=1 Tax=Chloracidobacterium validum TaxID=2821543 RepID=A0ABX8BD02_9BACT|nr:hypothetical protein [Chloracidobacterium validum]QUW03539.1 hypothetical protein J8C06_03625 [Chloracidobacterium validum]
MDIESLFRLPEDPDQVSVPARMWLCPDCGNVHLALGGAYYTFSPEQFRYFVKAVNACAVHYGLSQVGFAETLRRCCETNAFGRQN